jgi:uncharacterized membrane protein
MQRIALAAIVMGGAWAGPALAQVAPEPRVTLDLPWTEQSAPPRDASLRHSALKATTYKAGTTAVNFAIFSYAAGGAAGGATLALVALGASWTLYTVNDYLWDRFDPPPKQDAGETFDTQDDVWRNTKKFMTYKPAIAAFKYATVYAYTGSVVTTVVAGTATVLVNTVVFYANNIGWDYYDWWRGRRGGQMGPLPGPDGDVLTDRRRPI